MSSVGQALGGLVGGIVGFFTPMGALYGAQLGIMAGGLLDPPKVTGPRLSDLSVQTSTYGAVIPRVYGTVAITGNVFWLQGDKLTETKKTEGGKGGPESTTYSYSATFAVGLCEGPIAGVRRIWVGSDLWYDAGSDDLASIIASNTNASNFTLYLGTEDQEADPLIQADRGLANVSAQRGLAYIVFHNLPLEKYGNSLMAAQVKVEAAGDASSLPPRLLQETTVGGYPLRYYPRPINSAQGGILSFYGYDPLAGTGTIDGETVGNDEVLLTVSYEGKFFGTSPVPDGVLRRQYFSSGLITTRIGVFGGANVWWPEYSSFNYAIGNGVRKLLPWGEVTGQNTASVVGSLGDISDHLTGETGRYLKGIAISADGKRILVTTGSVARYLNSSANRYFILNTSLEILKSGTIALTSTGLWNIANNTAETPDGGTVFDNNDLAGWTAYLGSGLIGVRYFYVDGAGTMQMSDQINLGITGAGYAAVAYQDGIFYVLARSSLVAKLYAFTAHPSITTLGTPLSSIVQAECLKSDLLTAADLDVAQLTDSVRGYRVGQLGPLRAGLEQLRSAWPLDVVQSGYKIKFIRRGGASIATVPADDLDAREAGTESTAEIVNVREMDLFLPRQLSLQYLDVVREYDVNMVEETRSNTDAMNTLSIDLPVVLNAEEAKRITSMLLYLAWLERYDISFTLPPTYQHLEPADPITVNAENATYNLRLTSVNYLPDGRVECKAKYSSAALYTQIAVADEGQSTGGTITLSGPSVYELLDIPMLRDADNTPMYPVAMSGYLSGWPGGIIYRSDDGGQVWLDVLGFLPPGSVIGYATGTLPVHAGTVIDFTNRLTVLIYTGELSSVTQDQMFAGQNWFAYGVDGRWEIIAAQNCVLQGDGSYILSDFLRGQKGTEWASGLHVANDRIVLLDQNKLGAITTQSSAIGVQKLFRGITAGEAVDSDPDKAFTYTAVNLECLSPAHLTGTRHPTTRDWTISWTRRSRFGDWRDYIDAQLGETSESYTIEIYTDATFTTLKRTLSSVTPTVQYTSADQVTDFTKNQKTLYVRVKQNSSVVGAGYALSATLYQAGDPYWGDLAALLHFDGTNASTTITDESGTTVRTWTATGNAQISTARSKFGGASLLLDGTGDYVRRSSTGTEFTFGTGDFTIEAWIYPTAGIGGSRSIIAKYVTWSTNVDFLLEIETTAGRLAFYAGDSIPISLLSNALITLNTWTHVAIVRYNGVTRMYVNGVAQTQTHEGSVNIPNDRTTISIGDSGFASNYFTGNIEEVRITKGVARYVNNFTPLATAFEDY